MKEAVNPTQGITQSGAQAVQEFSTQQMEADLQSIAEYGGFSFLESFIEGIANLNPDRSTRRKIFLAESGKKKDREVLMKNISLWLEIFGACEDMGEMLEKCNERSSTISEVLSKNQLTAVKTVKDMEQSYRSVVLFYRNSEMDKIRNITIMNASPEQLTDLDNPRFIDCVNDELKQNYDKLDLRRNYSLLVLPGYLGSNMVLEKWAKIAYNNKTLLVTDFADLEKPDDVVDLFFDANLTGGDTYRSNTVMCCNWCIGRSRYSEIGETDHLHVPPSTALAGKIYNTLMSQVTAGKKNGSINEVDGVVFPLKKSELSQLESMGLVPLVYEFSKVMAFSGKTLFNGDNLGLQTYSVVRVFDYIFKVLCDFLNRRAFENWNSQTEKDLRKQIIKFLDSIKGPKGLIEKFHIVRFEQDKNQRDHVYLDISIMPYFPAKSFVIKLDGTKGEENNVEWGSDYEQEK